MVSFLGFFLSLLFPSLCTREFYSPESPTDRQENKERLLFSAKDKKRKKPNRNLVGSPKPCSRTRAIAGRLICLQQPLQSLGDSMQSPLSSGALTGGVLSSRFSAVAVVVKLWQTIYTESFSQPCGTRKSRCSCFHLSPTIEDGTEILGGPGNQLSPL